MPKTVALANGAYDEIDLAQQAALIAGPLAASCIQPIQAKTAVVDTIQSSNKISAVNGDSLPTLQRPEALDEKTFMQAKEDIKALVPQEPENEAGDIDDLVHQLLLNVINSSSGYLQAKRSFFDSERAWNEKIEQKRAQEVEYQLSKSKEVSTWEKVEKSLLSFGLLASGIGGICAGFFALGIPAIALGGLLAIDQLLDDKIKKTVASWMACGDTEGQKTWMNRIQVFCTVSSFGLSFGLSGMQAAQFAMTVANAVASSTKGVLDYQLNLQKAIVLELDAACRRAQTSVDRLIQEIGESCNTLYQFHENISHVSEQRRKLINSFMQFR